MRTYQRTPPVTPVKKDALTMLFSSLPAFEK